MCALLERIGVSEKVVKIIKSMYENTKGTYCMGELKTDWMRSKRGVRQGRVLSPLLFGVYTEELAVPYTKKNKGMGINRV